MNKRIYFSIGLLSASIIAFQLVLMQLLSISQWNHFAYMVISVAMLGFGASGTALTFMRAWLVKHIGWSLPALIWLNALTVGLIMHFADKVFGGFDSYLLFLDSSHIYGLVLSYLALFVPFFFGALAIGLAYVHYVERIGKLYFADLFGSGLGGLLMLILFWYFAPEKLPFIISFMPLLGGLLLLERRYWAKSLLLLLPLLALQLYGLHSPPAMPMSQYKSLSRSLLLPGAELVDQKYSPYGKLQLLQADGLRYAPGLSLTYTGSVPVRMALFNNGNWMGPLLESDHSDSSHFLNYATHALPFVIADPLKVLVPESGTGLYAHHAIAQGAQSITAVEPNRAALKLLQSHAPAPENAVHTLSRHPRSYLMADTSRYDLIILPEIESFGGSSGINALQEQYLFTLEAFSEMWDRLSDGGMIAATVWIDYPARNALKLLATFAETIENKSLFQAENHIAAIRGWGTVTFVLKNTPLTHEETDRIRAFCLKRNFDPLLLPDLDQHERQRFNRMQDTTFFNYVDQLMHTSERERLYEQYDFQIRPATDSKPYFSQFLRLSRLQEITDFFGQSAVPFLEIGYLIVWLTFVQISVIALLLILIPLLFIGFRGGGKAYTLLYFSGIGIGFMFIEIILIQQFTLFFGHTIYAATAVLSGMLLFSGAGSFFTKKWIKNQNSLVWVLGGIVLFIVLFSLVLMPLLRAGISQPMEIKILISIFIIGPLAFLMGMPFPSGLGFLSKKNNSLIPWAWGVNGCLSVISTALATIVAVEFGFTVVMLAGALAYLISLLINLKAL